MFGNSGGVDGGDGQCMELLDCLGRCLAQAFGLTAPSIAYPINYDFNVEQNPLTSFEIPSTLLVLPLC